MQSLTTVDKLPQIVENLIVKNQTNTAHRQKCKSAIVNNQRTQTRNANDKNANAENHKGTKAHTLKTIQHGAYVCIM